MITNSLIMSKQAKKFQTTHVTEYNRVFSWIVRESSGSRRVIRGLLYGNKWDVIGITKVMDPDIFILDVK
jgi:hypothetical protein